MKNFVILTLALLFTGECYADTPVQCKLIGQVTGIETKAVWLKKFNENIHLVIENKDLRIPVVNGKFTYEFTFIQSEAYEFVLDEELGSTRGLIFFPVEGTVEIFIQFNGYTTRLIANGGSLNVLYDKFNKSMPTSIVKHEEKLMKQQDALMKNNEFDSETFKLTKLELKAAGDDDEKKAFVYQKQNELEKTGARYTAKGWAFKTSWDSLQQVKSKWKFDYIRKNQTLVSYFLIYDVARFAKPNSLDLQLVNDAFPAYAKKFPEHPYTKILSKRLAGLTFIKPGYRYIDFTAKTLTGESQKISEVLTGKINLISFWGSWCGPCIVKARQIVPVYEKYKDKGFAVVGVAREFRSLNVLKGRLEKEQFNWLNLVELDDENRIWATYGVGDGAGLIVVVDYDGIILSVDPKLEELEKILKEKL